MPPVLLGTSYDKRVVGKLPPVRLVNRYLESTQTNQINGVALLPRPGLSPLATRGFGPIRGLYREPGLFGGALFCVSGSSFYRNATQIAGTVAGSDRIRWAGTDNVPYVFFVAGGNLYIYDGSTLDTVATPDDVEVNDVTEINGYIIVQVRNSGRRYFIRPGENTIDPLDYFTSESSPDGSVATVSLSSEVWLFDKASTEVWAPTGDADLPFEVLGGRTFSRGATARDTVIRFDNTIFFVGEDNEQGRVVYRASDIPERISTHAIEERLRLASSDLSSIGFILDGHAFYLVSSDQGTFAFDVSTGSWSEWASYGEDRFRAHVAAVSAGSPITMGDMETNQLYTLDPDRGNDNGEAIIRVVGGGLPTIQRFSVDNLWLVCNTGSSSDPDADPLILMRSSRDGGRTWGDEIQASLGRMGDYTRRVIWRRLGQFQSPGFLFEISDSEDVQTTFRYATVNEQW